LRRSRYLCSEGVKHLVPRNTVPQQHTLFVCIHMHIISGVCRVSCRVCAVCV
jgi:hypothetical protein